MEKLYQVVNKDDEVIGHKLRKEIDFKLDIYRIAALWLTNSNGDVLIAQRLLTKDKDPGKWGPAAAGTLEEGEDYETNIYKEAEEEIGLTAVAFTKGPKQRFHVRESFCQWFTGICDWDVDQFILQPDEVAQVEWVSQKSLIKDINDNPDKYVPSMSSIIDLLYT